MGGGVTGTKKKKVAVQKVVFSIPTEIATLLFFCLFLSRSVAGVFSFLCAPLWGVINVLSTTTVSQPDPNSGHQVL